MLQINTVRPPVNKYRLATNDQNIPQSYPIHGWTVAPANSVYIYMLKDPLTGAIHYVGKTNHPKRRYIAHYSYKHDNDLGRWLRGLHSKNAYVQMQIVCVTNNEEAFYIEGNLMDALRQNGHPLFNTDQAGPYYLRQARPR